MISVAIATYNGEEYIKKQLDSILNQSLQVDEIIIVDDQSTDDTVPLLKKYISSHREIKIYLYENEINQGYKKNFRNALSYCKGDYIFLCDQDDLWLNNKVETMIGIIKQNSNIKALASSFEFINKNDEIFEVEQVNGLSNNNFLRRVVEPNDLVQISFDELLIQNSFQGCALLITNDLKRKFLQCFTDEIFHDWLLNLLASEQNGMYFLNTPLFQYRIHDNNTIGINEQEHLSKVNRLIKTNTLHIRTQFAKASINTLNILEKVDDKLSILQPDYRIKKDFYEKHIEYLTYGKVIPLFFQNFNKYYKNIKTNKARIMDLLFAFYRKLC